MTYIKQLEKVKRYLNRIDPKIGYHGVQIDYEDNLWSFFQNAWHLKDYIKNEDSIIQFPIEKIVESYSSLKICADIANRTKHLKLYRQNRVDAKHVSTDVKVVVPINIQDILNNKNKPYPIIKAEGSYYNYIIQESNGTKHKAVELANQIVKDWEEIISKYVKLKTP